MIIVAIDLGTTMGVARYDTANRALSSATWRLRGSGENIWGERLHQMAARLAVGDDPDVYVYERVRRHVGTASAHAYGAYRGQLLLHAHVCGAEVATVEVAEWKRWAGLKGNATKDTISGELARRWPSERLGQDEGEARLMALCYATREGLL